MSLPLAQYQPLERPRGIEALYDNPLPWLIALAGAHVAVRVSTSTSLQWDEAQQILWTQQLSWGYGAQPPLYTWLQWIVNQALGPTILSLSFLKHVLIALGFVFTWKAARELMGERAAFWSAASLFMLPIFAWYAVNDLTHTILVNTMLCGVWWMLFRIVRLEGKGCLLEFIGLGLFIGAGILGKYSFVLALAALLIAFLSVRGPRQALLNRGTWLWTVLISTLMVAPHVYWMFTHWTDATLETAHVLRMTARYGLGLQNVLVALLAVLGLWMILAFVTFRSSWWHRPDFPSGRAPETPGWPAAWLRAVFGRYLAAIAFALVLMVFVASVTNMRDRWLAPFLACVPLMAFALRPGLNENPRGKSFTFISIGLALLMLIASGAQPWFSYIDGKPHPFNYPANRLVQVLRDSGYDGQGYIIASDHLLAGILRMNFPSAHAEVCFDRLVQVDQCVSSNVQKAELSGKGWLIITRDEAHEPQWWTQALALIAHSDQLPRGSLRVPYERMRPGSPLANYDFIWQPAQAKRLP
jgi:4-amino-4-deoxy-L-arabinose transferase-like glycosyltransferase